jgi:hypothetical protein
MLSLALCQYFLQDQTTNIPTIDPDLIPFMSDMSIIIEKMTK